MNILNKLTIKHLKMNKKRTIVTIIGVILSTALMVGIGLLFSTIRDNAIENIKRYSGNYHVLIKDFDYDNINKLDKVESTFYEYGIGFAYLENSENEYKPYLYINSVSKRYFDELKLIEGSFPKNDREVVISKHINENGGTNYKVGDILTLEIGNRIVDGEITNNSKGYDETKNEYLDIKETKSYNIVGIVERSNFESYSAPGYTIFTYSNVIPSNIDLYIRFNKPAKTYDLTDKIIKDLNIDSKDVQYNSSLLSAYGASNYDNIMKSMYGVMSIVLGLISIGCIVVIYNSFAISVMERKKHFGLYSSIGATRKQIRKTVFFEAIIVGLIGIPLGIISGFLGIGIVLEIINSLLKDAFQTPLRLSAYPVFIIIPILFMILVVLISAFLPALKASKITPIEAIRQNDDIKINKKKIRTNKLIKKIFGVESEIALKNIKRNKKKYRITVISLVTSIVLFISFSSILNYGITGSNDYYSSASYDVYVSVFNHNETVDSKVKEILASDEVKKKAIMNVYNFPIEHLSEKIYQKRYLEVLGDDLITLENYKKKELWNFTYVTFIVLDDLNYNSYLKEIGLNKAQPIFLNKQKYISYKDNSRKSYDLNIIKEDKLDLKLCKVTQVESTDNIEPSNNSENNSMVSGTYYSECNKNLENIIVSDKIPYGLEDSLSNSVKIIINKNIYDGLIEDYPILSENDYMDTQIVIEADKYTNLNKLGEQLNTTGDAQYINANEMLKMERNIILVVKILLYGFISLVTLIGVTSVFNTINTSLALRKKEFAMLRSMGLTPKGFNKILYFESVFFGLKSILYALPISLGVTYLIYLSVNNTMERESIIIPYNSIIISIFGVFIIVLMTMMYATKKMKKENIIDAIREENI
ncbi:MAG: ABC transporter permease [Ignavibacteriales bacterium]